MSSASMAAGSVRRQLPAGCRHDRPAGPAAKGLLLRAVPGQQRPRSAPSFSQAPRCRHHSRPTVIAGVNNRQGVACLQSAQLLIADSRPVGALPSLHGLVTIAARFEQMAGESRALGLAGAASW